MLNKEVKNEIKFYPAVVTQEDGIYYIGLVDFDKEEDRSLNYYALKSKDLEKLLSKARENLALKLYDLSNKKRKFPNPSQIKDIKIKDNQYITFILIDPIYEISKVSNKLKKKTVNIPVWLDIVAMEKKVNFSKILQRALKKELGFKDNDVK